MFDSHRGELAALVTAFCWAIAPLFFETAVKKAGTWAVNFLKLIFSFLILSIFLYWSRGMMLPLDASLKAWLNLGISGLLGFVIGDLFLFKSYALIGSRLAWLIVLSATPIITSLLGFLFLGEVIALFGYLGMALIILGMAIITLNKNAGGAQIRLAHSGKGLMFAFLGAVGQACGFIFSKYGMGKYDPFAATQLRIIAAIAGFVVVLTVFRKWSSIGLAWKDKLSLRNISLGALFGPSIGVAFSLLAVQYTSTGIVSTITSISPILMFPASYFILKERIRLKELLGAMISIGGIIILFWK